MVVTQYKHTIAELKAERDRMEEALRQALRDDPEKWSFDTLVTIAWMLLDTHWPADVFDGSSGDAGPVFVARLREALERVSG